MITEKLWLVMVQIKLLEVFLINFFRGMKQAQKEPMRDSDFLLYCIDGLFYKYNKISLNCGGPYL